MYTPSVKILNVQCTLISDYKRWLHPSTFCDYKMALQAIFHVRPRFTNQRGEKKQQTSKLLQQPLHSPLSLSQQHQKSCGLWTFCYGRVSIMSCVMFQMPLMSLCTRSLSLMGNLAQVFPSKQCCCLWALCSMLDDKRDLFMFICRSMTGKERTDKKSTNEIREHEHKTLEHVGEVPS